MELDDDDKITASVINNRRHVLFLNYSESMNYHEEEFIAFNNLPQAVPTLADVLVTFVFSL